MNDNLNLKLNTEQLNTKLNTQNLFMDYPDVVSVEQLTAMLHIGKVLAYRLIRDKQIKSKRVGREYKIPKAAVVNYLNDTEVSI